MRIPLALCLLCALAISLPDASEDATWTQRGLLRQELSDGAKSRSRIDAKKGTPHVQESPLRQPMASDPVEAKLLRVAEDLHLPEDETAQVVSASRAVRAPRAPEANNANLRDSVLFAAKRLGLSRPQVDRLKLAMANLDHRSYVHILQVLQIAATATASVPAKVAAVVTAAAEANYSAEEVGAAAAAASLALAEDAATTTVPLQSLADAVGQLGGVEGQAAVVAAAGGESPRSQSIIAEMFEAISSTTAPMFRWGSSDPAPFGLDPEIVGDAVKDEISDVDISDQDKMDIVNAAMNAAAAAERPNLRLNGTLGLDESFAGDLLALDSAAFNAGFTEHEVEILKLKWQDMTSQQRAAAKRSFDALASGHALVGLRNLGQGNLSAKVAGALKAFEDAGASTADAAQVAADVLRTRLLRRADHGANGNEVKDKTGLQKTVEYVKSARLSEQQAQAVLKFMAGLSPEDATPVAIAWAAIGGQTSAATTQAPLPWQEEHEAKGQQRFSVPTPGINLQALEELNAVAFAALQAGIDLDLVDKADRIARGMSPTEQMAAAAAIIRLPQDKSGDPTVKKEVTLEELESALGIG